MNPNGNNNNHLASCGSILPAVWAITNFPTEKSIVEKFTLNREQCAAFIIITSHLDGDSRRHTVFLQYSLSKINIYRISKS